VSERLVWSRSIPPFDLAGQGGRKAAALLWSQAGHQRMAGRHLFLDLPFFSKATFQIDGQLWPGRADPFSNDPAFLDGHHSGLRTIHHQASRVIAVSKPAGRVRCDQRKGTHNWRPSLNTARRAIRVSWRQAEKYS